MEFLSEEQQPSAVIDVLPLSQQFLSEEQYRLSFTTIVFDVLLPQQETTSTSTSDLITPLSPLAMLLDVLSTPLEQQLFVAIIVILG